LHKECWFENKKNIGKYKGTSITKACVSQLAWNKEGREALAIGTTSGLVSVYDAQAPYKNIMLVKGHEGVYFEMQAISKTLSGTLDLEIGSFLLPSRIKLSNGM
jgi:hypothetical protein